MRAVARQIQLLYLNLVAIDKKDGSALVNAAKSNVSRMFRDSEPHANCLRSFARLYRRKPAQAAAYFSEISEFSQNNLPLAGSQRWP